MMLPKAGMPRETFYSVREEAITMSYTHIHTHACASAHAHTHTNSEKAQQPCDSPGCLQSKYCLSNSLSSWHRTQDSGGNVWRTFLLGLCNNNHTAYCEGRVSKPFKTPDCSPMLGSYRGPRASCA